MRLIMVFFGSFWLLLSGGKLAAQDFHRYHFRHPQMGTVFQLTFFANQDTAAAATIARDVFNRIDTLNAIFSDWLPESELNRLCATAGSGRFIPVSDALFDILGRSKSFSKKSAGAFDISIGPLTRLWRRSRNLKELPAADKINAARARVDWRQIELNHKKRQVRLKLPGMALDLGGIAQGWAADDGLRRLKQQGITMAMLDAGGDIAIGAPPPGQPGWSIEAPVAEGETALLYLKNCGITTSGATYRYLEVDGVRYSHIVHPHTGMALTHRTLVTVQAPDATTADAWATAISVLGEAGWLKLKKKPAIKVWLAETPL